MSESRPVTSKSRGVCRYYNTPRGCFNGKKCKFVHGESERLTPFDKAKTCIYYAKGYCKRGGSCWFAHELPDKRDAADDVCGICLEKPLTYGLLSTCNHVFCIDCIKQWRDPHGKSGEVVSSGSNKNCPLCRTESKMITPSSRFLSSDSPQKEQIVSQYRESMSRVPCRYFQATKSTKPFCPFGCECFYGHIKDDGTPHTFPRGVDTYMPLHQKRLRHAAGPAATSASTEILLSLFSDEGFPSSMISGPSSSANFWGIALETLDMLQNMHISGSLPPGEATTSTLPRNGDDDAEAPAGVASTSTGASQIDIDSTSTNRDPLDPCLHDLPDLEPVDSLPDLETPSSSEGDDDNDEVSAPPVDYQRFHQWEDGLVRALRLRDETSREISRDEVQESE